MKFKVKNKFINHKLDKLFTLNTVPENSSSSNKGNFNLTKCSNLNEGNFVVVCKKYSYLYMNYQEGINIEYKGSKSKITDQCKIYTTIENKKDIPWLAMYSVFKKEFRNKEFLNNIEESCDTEDELFQEDYVESLGET